MNAYLQRVAASILPLSKERNNIKIALQEWSFEGKVEDHEKPTEVCQLCQKQGLRYKFLIENQYTSHELWIGSECIDRFNISVADPQQTGRYLSKEEAQKLTTKTKNQMIEQGKYNSVLRSLMILKEAEENAKQENPVDISSFMRYYEKNGKFTPSQGALLAWRMNQFNIVYAASHFKIDLRGNNKAKLLQLKPIQIEGIKDWLTKSQLAMYEREKGTRL
ncbi:hypothetical protein [Paenibacillus bovis]|uniref:Uncharacterized protein n=1 Tax=Paenibacillus bovis TaxID=1616788 RepID=A0A1X9T3X4_9BACL|nr:hypothetical protein [Paenibacillus bovis]ARR10633.1 hypothetical protein AR543_p0025 [Paenibacillus bovis]